MPKQLFVDGRIFVGAYDLSGDTNRLAAELDRAEHDVTTLADKRNQIREPGLKIARMSASGFWAAGAEAVPTAQRLDSLLFGNLDLVDVPLTFLTKDAAGEPGFAMRGTTARYRPGPGQHGAKIPFEFAAELSSSPFVRGHCLHVGQVVADGQGVAVNLGQVPAGKSLYAVLHVFGVGAAGHTIDVKIQSDDAQGFATPLDRLVFAQKNGFGHDWAVAIPGPIADTWWRTSHDLSVGAVSFDYAVLMAIQ